MSIPSFKGAFEFSTAGRILFGAGMAGRVAETAAAFQMRRCLVVTGRSRERWAKVLAPLERSGAVCAWKEVSGEPSVATVREGVEEAHLAGCDGVIAIGGGSVLDAGKAIAAMLRNEGDVTDYLEVIGKGRSLKHASAPWIALPTTAGTGAEVTRNAVLSSPERKVKVSLRSPWMLPVAAIVDPELTLSSPARQTAWSGMDALTQLIEPFVSSRANPMTDGYCREGMPRVARSLKRAFENGNDLEARTEMALGSLLGGLALANAGLGVVHGFAGVLGGMSGAPHGAICAALLAEGMAANVAHLKANPDCARREDLLERFTETARFLTGRADAVAEEGIEFVHALGHALGIPSLGALGLTAAQENEAVAKALQASSMKANGTPLSEEALRGVYRGAL